MFSSAFKSFSSNILSNYEVSKQPTSSSGAWAIFDAKKKSTGAQASIFVFDRKSLEFSSGGFGARPSATSIRKVQDEVVERLKKEASSLARLRHPSILQLVEPVEDTRGGGLMFATEPILASLSGALEQKDRGERSSARSRSPSNLDVSLGPVSEVELDELEIQKGLLQVAKGLEFLHDSAKLVHGNLTPDAVFINAKSDWKISGLAFAGPPDGAEGHQAIPQISLSEVLYQDPRIPPFVQLNLDYTSPDFVLDSNINFGADMFSLGLLLLACYRKPHRSPIETHGNQSTYKKLFSNASTVPSPSNNYLCTDKLPQELSQTLPKVLARRPAQRLTASEFQQSEYFDNILVNTMRFLDSLPAKSPAEKSQFMRGLGRVLPQFPPSVLGKKVLSALLDEMKDRELLALILQNVFKIIKVLPSGHDVVSDKILPRMREIFLSKPKSEERDTSREAGLLIVLENIKVIAENCTAKQFKDDVLPIVHVAMESNTHSLTDAALQTIPTILPLTDFSTVKHDLFPVVAGVFSKTSSLSIKVRGLEALGVLCGVSQGTMSANNDDLNGRREPGRVDKHVSSLDKFTMQEKVVPLLKAIKTKEPAVMMAALKVFRQVVQVGDIDFLAMEVMPILWTFALGPLLDLSQFQSFMEVIKALSARIEREQTRKLQELSSSRPTEPRTNALLSNTMSNGSTRTNNVTGTEDDFAKLVLGSKEGKPKEVFEGALTDGQRLTPNPPSFSWSSSNSTVPQRSFSSTVALQAQPTSRSITPDVTLASFPSLQPAASASSLWATPMSAQVPSGIRNPSLQASNDVSNQTISPPPSTTVPWQTQRAASSSFSPAIAPPPINNNQFTSWQQPNYNAGMNNMTMNNTTIKPLMPGHPSASQQQQPQQSQSKTGLDKYQSLL